MSRLIGVSAGAAAVIAAALAGLYAGQSGLLRLPLAAMPTAERQVATGEVIYYRDPDGRPYYSLEPRRTEGGRDYVAVRSSEDLSFDPQDVTGATGSVERKIKYYRHPMGLPETSPTPKKDSMGMDYIPVYEGEDTEDTTVKIGPGKIQRTGVETVTVGKHPVTRTVRAPGTVQLDERRITVIAPRYEGFIESVGQVTSGTHVKEGELLASVFGQELLNQGARLLIEQDTGIRGRDTSDPPGANSPGGLIGARRRLLNLGAPQEFIDQIKKDNRVPDSIALRAPSNAIVLERNAVNGQAFKAGDVLFRLADHSTVWVMAEVPETEIGALKPGQDVKVTARAHPGRTFTGKVAVIYPHLMKETRTAQVRIEMPNPDLSLLPDMYAEVEIATGADAEVVAVPSGAVIDSGERQVVLVDLGDGRYEPREVKLGRKGDGFIEITSGVQEGENVVVNGNFLIDAESNLRAALKGFSAPSTMPKEPSPPPKEVSQ